MPVIIKTGTVSVDSTGSVCVVEPPFKNAQIDVGDTAYLWTCETSGGEGLAIRGHIQAIEPTATRHRRITIGILDRTPRRPLGKATLEPLRNSTSTAPDSTLSKTLYRHSHRKIADLILDEATYLDSFFDEVR